MSDSLRHHDLQHARLPCPSPTPRATQNHVHWVGDAIQPSHPVVLFSSRPQSFLASGSFPTSQLFASGGQSFGDSASATVFSMNTQGWFSLEFTGLISLQSKALELQCWNRTPVSLGEMDISTNSYSKLWSTTWFTGNEETLPTFVFLRKSEELAWSARHLRAEGIGEVN